MCVYSVMLFQGKKVIIRYRSIVFCFDGVRCADICKYGG